MPQTTTQADHSPARVSQGREWSRFAREFAANPLATAAVAPSSRYLADRMLEGIDFARVDSIIEFGPGTGSFTRRVADRLNQAGNTRCRLLAIELNERMADDLQDRLPRALVRAGDARQVRAYCDEIDLTHADYIISGLGWPSIPPGPQTAILEATRAVLRPGGEFRTFGYHIGLTLPGAWGFRRTVRRLFDEVQISRVVWRNIPPAFVYTCRIAADPA